MNYIFKSYLFIINIISFFLYYLDKRKAIRKKYRISEKVLIIFGLIGGCYGSLAGMYLIRHKTKHLKFIILIPFFCLVWTLIILKKLQIL